MTPSKRAESGPALDDKQVGSLKSTLSKMRSDDSEAVEEELRGILDQMGLIDDEPKEDTEVKREVEDENLETGTNNIEMIKVRCSKLVTFLALYPWTKRIGYFTWRPETFNT